MQKDHAEGISPFYSFKFPLASFDLHLLELFCQEYSEEIERLQRDLEATRQRTGIYLDQSEYDNMMLVLEQLAAEIKEKEEEKVALIEEMEKKKVFGCT